MNIYDEKIAPPLAPLNDDEQKKVRMEAIASEDRWVETFIDRLADVIRDIKP
jgi:nicotinamide mononucleotide adenylyltransferase